MPRHLNSEKVDLGSGRIVGSYVEKDVDVSVKVFPSARECCISLARDNVGSGLTKGVLFKKVLKDVVRVLESPQGRVWRLRANQKDWEEMLATLHINLNRTHRAER